MRLFHSARRLLPVAVLLALFLSPRPTAAQGAEDPSETAVTPRAMSVVDLLSLPGVDDPRLSPDGSDLAYVKETSDWERNRRIGHIWLHDVETGEAFPLTNGDDGERSPRWSPDGAQIAFLADRSDTLET